MDKNGASRRHAGLHEAIAPEFEALYEKKQGTNKYSPLQPEGTE